MLCFLFCSSCIYVARFSGLQVHSVSLTFICIFHIALFFSKHLFLFFKLIKYQELPNLKVELNLTLHQSRHHKVYSTSFHIYWLSLLFKRITSRHLEFESNRPRMWHKVNASYSPHWTQVIYQSVVVIMSWLEYIEIQCLDCFQISFIVSDSLTGVGIRTFRWAPWMGQEILALL